MDIRTIIKCAASVAVLLANPLAAQNVGNTASVPSAKGSKDPVAKLAEDMVPIPGKDYAICKYEVTQALWEAVMGNNPSKQKGPNLPVDYISWHDSQNFIELLNEKPEVKKSGIVYRLPTAEEWKEACLAGGTGDYCKMADGTEINEDTINEVAWSWENSAHDPNPFAGSQLLHPVGQKKPNAFGLYDMLGNVWEWMSNGGDNVYRKYCCGGSKVIRAQHISADCRTESHIKDRGDGYGFRLAAKASELEAAKKNAGKEREEPVGMGAADESKSPVAKLADDMVQIPGKNFAICKFEVTQALWEAVMDDNPSRYRGSNLPVEQVSWDDCQEFIEALNEMPEVKESGLTYRLPTGEEWVYACRAGTTYRGFTGDCYCRLADGKDITVDSLEIVAWYKDNGNDRTHPVGQKKPNAFGLYDMLGNVREWSSTEEDNRRLTYGGDFSRHALNCSANDTGSPDPRGLRYQSLGFRLAATTGKEEVAADKNEEAAKAALAEKAKTVVDKLSADMVPIPGKKYAMCKYEVTQDLWETVMGDNPSKLKGANLPVEQVSWDDCQKFLEKLNALPGVKEAGVVYRLPTAMEWEYACRAGAMGEYCKLADGTEITRDTLMDVAWYGKITFIDHSDRAKHPVGLKKPNAFGLYDMIGNVKEWTSTVYFEKYMCCGGCWYRPEENCRASYRDMNEPDRRFDDLGFRLARGECEELLELEAASKDPIAKLAADMVSIPGKNFELCKYEVTQALWEKVMGANPSDSKGANRPVVNVSWKGCQMFLEKLNALQEVKEAGFIYRLPTADEWEYACRAGAEGNFCKLENGTEITEDTLGVVAWYRGNNYGIAPVGQRMPNAFGLYDMNGNVSEWTLTGSNQRIVCGGSILRQVKDCEANYRESNSTTHYKGDLGLRLARGECAELKKIKDEIEAASKGAVAKLATDMVPIPGKGYSMCKYEVTQALWAALMGYNANFTGANNPVENVSWDDCQKFIEKLNALPEVKETGVTYCLPTADEWDYACRAGATGDYSKLADGTEITKETLGQVAWFDGNSNNKARPVGKKKPNAFGLYDMNGNVSEWTATEQYGYERITCGGCWMSYASDCKAEKRISIRTTASGDALGFRLAADSGESVP